MVIKYGRYGKFLACPGFPECQNAKPYFEEAGVNCPECGGPVEHEGGCVICRNCGFSKCG